MTPVAVGAGRVVGYFGYAEFAPQISTSLLDAGRENPRKRGATGRFLVGFETEMHSRSRG